MSQFCKDSERITPGEEICKEQVRICKCIVKERPIVKKPKKPTGYDGSKDEKKTSKTNKKGEKCYEQVKKCKCIVKERLLGSSKIKPPAPTVPPPINNSDPCPSLDFNDPIFCGGCRRQPYSTPGPPQILVQPTYATPVVPQGPPGPTMMPRVAPTGNYYSEIQPRPYQPYGNYNPTNPPNMYYNETYYGSAPTYQR